MAQAISCLYLSTWYCTSKTLANAATRVRVDWFIFGVIDVHVISSLSLDFRLSFLVLKYLCYVSPVPSTFHNEILSDSNGSRVLDCFITL